MARTNKREIPEAEAERQVIDSLERLDELRVEELKQISEEQGWKMEILRSELERLSPTLTPEHPRLLKMKTQLEHYSLAREAIGILVNGADDTEEPKPSVSWELSGIVRFQKLESPEGLKVSLGSDDKNLETLEAECDANGFYQLKLEGELIQRYKGVAMVLKVYYKRKLIFTDEKPILIESGKQQKDIDI